MFQVCKGTQRIFRNDILFSHISCFLNHTEINSSHICLPYLAIDDWYPRNKVSVCFLSALSSGDDKSDIITLDDVDRMTIPEIANKIDSLRQVAELEKSKKCIRPSPWNFFSVCPEHKAALVIISPDTENSKLDMTIFPQSINATVVIGGVRVMKRESKKVYTLSMSITVNCVRCCSVGMCRRFAEHLQKILQEPESL
jgi:hypothetical protein